MLTEQYPRHPARYDPSVPTAGDILSQAAWTGVGAFLVVLGYNLLQGSNNQAQDTNKYDQHNRLY